MLPFGAGLLYARYVRPWGTATNFVAFILSMIAILLMSFSYLTWYFVPLAICIASITFVKFDKSLRSSYRLQKLSFMNILSWVGSISAALFVCHPITRKIFIPISKAGDYWTGLLLLYHCISLFSMAIQGVDEEDSKSKVKIKATRNIRFHRKKNENKRHRISQHKPLSR